MEILFTLFALLLFHYIYFIGRVYSGLRRLKYSASKNRYEKVSVVIPLRNEVQNVQTLCESLINQSLKPENFEIIFVDDNSNDGTQEILRQLAPPNSRIISTEKISDTGSRKKIAVMTGIKEALNPVIVVTDADCTHDQDWLQTIAEFFEPETAVAAGPVDFSKGETLFQKFQRLEFAGLILTGAGLIGAGKPTICSAANLAYRKSVFEEVGGFETHLNFASGDDDLFLQKVASMKKHQIKFLFDRKALVKTSPQKSASDFLEQRKRWASKFLFYDNKYLVLQIILIALFYIGLIVQLFVGVLFNLVFLAAFLFSFASKILIEFLVLRFGAKHIYGESILKVFLAAELIQIPYIIYSFFSGFIGNFKWKDERRKR